jgi:hypothetical protein
MVLYFANVYAIYLIQVFGLLTKPLINLLIPPRPGNAADLSSQSFLDPLLSSLLGSDLDIGQYPPQTNLELLLTIPTRSVHRVWRKFDDRFMRPMFGGRGFVPFVPGSPVERSTHGGLGSLGTVTEADNHNWVEAKKVQIFLVCKSSDTTQFCSWSLLMYCCIRRCILCI